LSDAIRVTTKKVEIVTTKNVERKIQRQVVLEDGRVVEEEIPTVTVDTTEDKQTFETDQDEERNLEGEGTTSIANRFDTSGGVLVGDKFTSRKKINDVRENLVKTEAMQDLGDIRSKDVKKVLGEKDDIRKYLRSRKGSDQQVAVKPRTVYSSRNHKVVTDKEDVQERNWLNKGKMQNERIRTEEHIEYDSDDTPDDGSSSSSSKSSHHKYEPEIYKTRKDENFTEYFKAGKENKKQTMVKIGDGPHYVSESKEVQREDENLLSHQPARPIRAKQLPRHLLAEVDANIRVNKKPINHTDSWLEKHFGSTSSLSASSTEASRPSSREGYGLRRSASICDIRPTHQNSTDFYATVRKSGKVPDVKMREKRQDGTNYSSRRVSANFSSSGHPVRPPRKSKGSDYESLAFSRPSKKPEPDYGSLKQNSRGNRSHSSHVTEKYHFGNPVTVRKTPVLSPETSLHRSYSSVQNLQRTSKPSHHSTENVRKEQRSSISSRHRAGDSHTTRHSSADLRPSERKVPVRDERSRYSAKPDSYLSRPVSSKIIYTRDTPAWAQDTKYRTKIVINGED